MKSIVMVQYVTLEEKLGILTDNATTPYILGSVNLEITGQFGMEPKPNIKQESRFFAFSILLITEKP